MPFQPNGSDPFFPLDKNHRLALDTGCNLNETWKIMESFLETGKVRAIGVSNFTLEHLEQLATGGARIMPMVNQIEIHPYVSVSMANLVIFNNPTFWTGIDGMVFMSLLTRHLEIIYSMSHSVSMV